jgi:hypothetical protein
MYHCGLEEEDGSAGSGTVWVHWCHGDNGVMGSGMMVMWARGRRRSTMLRARERHGVHIVTGSERTTLLCVREWRRGLRDGACMVDSVTGSGRGRWWRVKGLDRGRERQHGEDSTTAQRLQGRLDDGTKAPGRTRRWHGLQGNFRWEIW